MARAGGQGDAASRPGGGEGGGAREGTRPRPSTADHPPTDGEVAARRIIHGHLDTEELDPVTARAVELLAAADLLAAEHYLATGQSAQVPRRQIFSDPMRITMVIAMFCLLVLGLGYLKLAQSQNSLIEASRVSHDQRAQLTVLTEENKRLSEEIASCVTPGGECAKRGAAAQEAAIESIVTQITVNACKIAHVDDRAATLLCISDVGGKP